MTDAAIQRRKQKQNWWKTGLEQQQFVSFGMTFFLSLWSHLALIILLYGICCRLVPSWIPHHNFCSYFRAIALIGSGVAIILKIHIKLVALLLSGMQFIWSLILHIPRAIADSCCLLGNEISSVFEPLTFSGIALGIACLCGNRNQSTSRVTDGARWTDRKTVTTLSLPGHSHFFQSGFSFGNWIVGHSHN